MSGEEIIDAEVEEIAAALPSVRESTAIVARGEITVAEVVAQHTKIVDVMQAVMRPDVHYGIIPGVRNPSLFKAGAETLLVALRLAPHYVSEKIWHDDGHLTVSVVCTLKHIQTGLEIATGEGLCSSRESRYAYRQENRECPECGKAAIIKGKQEYGGGWVCFKKKEGCGAKWADGTEQAQAFESAEIGRVDNPDLADTFNTVLKMADKRALIAAVLNGTAASDVFTQDVEDGGVESAPVERQAERRQEQAGTGVKAPTSWAKLTEMVSVYDEVTYKAFMGFSSAASRLLFGTDVAKDLSKADKDFLFQKTSGAALLLREQFDPNELPYPTVDEIRTCFARVLDGQELALEGEA